MIPFFSVKERDSETGLDYFEARYYGSIHGRFISPDEFTGGPDELFDFAEDASDNPTFYADIYEPQSLNKYQYCYNAPLTYVDHDGHQGKKISDALQQAGNAMGKPGNHPSVQKAGAVVKIVARIAGIVNKIDLGDLRVGEGDYTCAKTGRCGDQRKSKKEDKSNSQAQAQQQTQPETAPQPQGMAKPTPQSTEPEPTPEPTPERGHRKKRKSTRDPHTMWRSGDKHPPNYKPFRHPPKKPPKPAPTPMPNKGPKKKGNDD